MTTTASLTDADLAGIVARIRQTLREALDALNAEIATYPTPIPRCDAQFNHLYEQRTRIVRALAEIDSQSSRGDLVRRVEEFVAAARYTERAAEERLRAELRAALH